MSNYAASCCNGVAHPSSFKNRRCLRCKTQFESEWSGERICPKCKGSSAWRNGEPYKQRRTSRSDS